MFPVNGSLLATPPFPRSGPGESSSPTSSGTMKALRPPLSASPVTYLVRFRCPRDSSMLRARCCQRSRAGGGPASGQDHWSAGDPIAGVFSRGREWDSQVPRQSILCLCLGLRPRPNRRSLASGGLTGAAPAAARAKASACYRFRGYRGASAPAVYASRVMLPSPMQDSLPAGWLAFTGRECHPR